MPIWYVYPMWHRVSFTLIARKHLEYMRRWVRVDEIDELAFPNITPHSRPIVLIHPYFYVMMRSSRSISRKLHAYGAFIGIDVADSDHISNLAVSMTNYAHAMIVPSEFARRAYLRSGVTVPVHVVPHGLDDDWYHRPRARPAVFTDIARLKERRGARIALFFLWHSDYRKGADLVLRWYAALRRERRDVILVAKVMDPNSPFARSVMRLGGIVVSGWLTEDQKMELYDLADIYPLFTRGGGFEMNGLEAIARNVPVIAAKGGSWEDYLPDWSLAPSRTCPYVLKDNPIHDGRGVEVVVEKAVDLAHKILDNLDDYRARLREHVERNVVPRFRWSVAARKILDIVFNVKSELGL